MKPRTQFLNQPKRFWANVRTVSEQAGYTVRGTGQIRVPTLAEMNSVIQKIGLSSSHIVDERNQATELGETLHEYFIYRAQVLNTFVEPRLMNANRAKQVFKKLHAKLSPKCPIPMNKQKGSKKGSGVLNRHRQHAD